MGGLQKLLYPLDEKWFDAIPDELVQEEKILNTATILIEWSLRSEQ